MKYFWLNRVPRGSTFNATRYRLLKKIVIITLCALLVAFVLGIISSRLDANMWSAGTNIKTKTHPRWQSMKKITRLSTEDFQQLNWQSCPIDFLTLGEWIWDPRSRESV
jgi:hypothetical protein